MIPVGYYRYLLPGWVTLKVPPATIRVPVREEVLEFDETEKVVFPLPFPLLPAVIVIQETLLEAVQEQPF